MSNPRVWIRTPYSIERNLGKAYNDEMAMIPTGDTAVFIDGDVCFLTPDYGVMLQHYAKAFPDAVLTCWTNRIHELAVGQRMKYFSRQDSVRDDIKQNMAIAEMLSKHDDLKATQLDGPVSGFLLMIPKHIWQANPFSETNKYRPNEPNLLGVDNEWTNRIRKAGIQILRMDNMLVWHSYRLLSNGKDKSHLL